jgi:sulfur carrier protein
MNIILNNRAQSFEQSNLTVAQLLLIMKYSYKLLIIKVNNELVKKDKYESFNISDGDHVEVIHLMSGG